MYLWSRMSALEIITTPEVVRCSQITQNQLSASKVLGPFFICLVKLQRGFCNLCNSLLNHCIHNLHFAVETISKRPTFSTWLYSLYQIPLHLSLLKCCWRRRQLANPWWNVVFIRSSPPFTRSCVPWRWTDRSFPQFRLTSNIWIGRISVDFWCTGPEQPKENISYVKKWNAEF